MPLKKGTRGNPKVRSKWSAKNNYIRSAIRI